MSLFLVGSGPTDTLDAVYDEFVQQARSRGGRVAIAMLGDADETAQFVPVHTEPITQRWPEADIVLVHLDDDGETDWPDDLDSVSALVVTGGWTPGYLDALIPQRDTISRLVRGGVPYLGFSAGAMVVSRHAIVGGFKHRGRQTAPEVTSEGMEELTVRDGLALIGPTVETHTDAWSTLGTAMAALEASDARTAVTIDEGTCLVVEPASGRTRVLGPGRVHWLQQEGVHIVVSHDESPETTARNEAHDQAAREAREQAARGAQQPDTTTDTSTATGAPDTAASDTAASDTAASDTAASDTETGPSSDDPATDAPEATSPDATGTVSQGGDDTTPPSGDSAPGITVTPAGPVETQE